MPLPLALSANRREEEAISLQPFDVDTGHTPGSEPVLDIPLVEDNPVNQGTLRCASCSVGASHRVVVANNGAEALEWFEKRFDVILMDMQMPVMGVGRPGHPAREMPPPQLGGLRPFKPVGSSP